MQFKRERLKDFVAISVFVILLLMSTWKLFNSRMISVPDLPAFPSLDHAIFLFKSAWLPLSNFLVFAPIETILAFRIVLISLVGGNVVLVQKIYVLIPFFLAFFSMYVLLRRYFSSRYILFLGAFFYSINPVTIKVFIDMSCGWLYVHGLLPLLIYFMDDAMRLSTLISRKRIQLAFLFSIVFAFSFANGLHTVIVLAPFVVYNLCMCAFKVRNFRQLLTKLLGLFLLFIPASLPIIISNFSIWHLLLEYIGPTSQKPLSPIFYSFDGHRNPLFSITALQTFESTNAFGWGTSWIIIFSGIALVLFIYGGFLLRRKENEPPKALVNYYLLLSCTIISFTYLIHLKKLNWLIENLRFLSLLGTPDLPLLLLAFCYSFLLSFTLNRMNRKNFSRALTILLVALCLMNWPVFTGHLGLHIARSEARETFPYTISDVPSWIEHTVVEEEKLLEADYRTYFPDHFSEILELIQSDEEPFRTYWLPFVHMEIESRLQNTEADPLYVPLGMDKLLDLEITPFLKAIADAIAGDLAINNIGSLLAPLNVKYFVVNLASRSTGPITVLYEPAVFNVQILGDPEAMASFLNTQRDLCVVYSSPKYLIYENMAYIPRVYPYVNTLIIRSSENFTDEERVSLQNLLAATPTFEVREWNVVFGNQLSDHDLEKLSKHARTMIYSQQSNPSIHADGSFDAVVFPISWNSNVSLELGDAHSFKIFIIPVRGRISARLEIDDVSIPLNETALGNGVLESPIAQISNGASLRLVPGATELNYGEDGLVWRWTYGDVEVDGRLEGGASIEADGLRFNGDGRLVVENSSVAFGDEDFTLEAWINLDSVSDEPVFVKGTGPCYSLLAFGGKARFSLSYPLASGELSTISVDSSVALQPEKWYHIVATRKAGEYLRVWVNGLYRTVRDDASDVGSEMPLQIGAGLNGLIASARIYNRTLTEEEVSEHYESGINLLSKSEQFAIMIKCENGSDPFPSFEAENANPSFSLQGYGSEYQANISTSEPAVLVFSEPYHKSWKAYFKNGTELPHFRAFGYINGYLLDDVGSFTIKFYFEGQKSKDILIQFWVFSWGFLLAVACGTLLDVKHLKRLDIRYLRKKGR